MRVNNSLAARSGSSTGEANKKQSLSAYLAGDAVKARINQVVGGKDGTRFISAVVSAVQTTPALKDCTNKSILSAALLGEALKLSPSPQLGHYYMVPYDNKNLGQKEAQFQLGYKGYIQLAIRSGQYRKINVIAIKKGELEYFDPLNEEIKVNLMVDDWDAREAAETIGYYCFFELINGFKKALYWSKSQMLNHADKYSPAFSKYESIVRTRYGEKKKVSFADYEAGNYDPKDAWMYSSFWYKSFDEMAYKTMLRQLISKWGVMSIDLRTAFEADMGVINEDGSVNYVETDSGEFPPAEVMPGEIIPEPETVPEVVIDAAPPEEDAVAAALFGGN